MSAFVFLFLFVVLLIFIRPQERLLEAIGNARASAPYVVPQVYRDQWHLICAALSLRAVEDDAADTILPAEGEGAVAVRMPDERLLGAGDVRGATTHVELRPRRPQENDISSFHSYVDITLPERPVGIELSTERSVDGHVRVGEMRVVWDGFVLLLNIRELILLLGGRRALDRAEPLLVLDDSIHELRASKEEGICVCMLLNAEVTGELGQTIPPLVERVVGWLELLEIGGARRLEEALFDEVQDGTLSAKTARACAERILRGGAQADMRVRLLEGALRLGLAGVLVELLYMDEQLVHEHEARVVEVALEALSAGAHEAAAAARLLRDMAPLDAVPALDGALRTAELDRETRGLLKRTIEQLTERAREEGVHGGLSVAGNTEAAGALSVANAGARGGALSTTDDT